ncbi:MAG: hypothetical protein AAGG51_22960 [Cyanobacteria bacterium P01_G01_bin.54]
MPMIALLRKSVRKSVRYYAALTLMGLMVARPATALSEGQITQCNRLIAVINQGEAIDQRFTEETQALARFREVQNFAEFKAVAQEMSIAFSTISDEINAYLGDVNAIELADEALVAYQDAYTEQGRTFSILLRDATELFGRVSALEINTNGDPTPESAQQLMELAPRFQELDFQTNVAESRRNIDAVISDINAYCGVTPSVEGE